MDQTTNTIWLLVRRCFLSVVLLVFLVLLGCQSFTLASLPTSTFNEIGTSTASSNKSAATSATLRSTSTPIKTYTLVPKLTKTFTPWTPPPGFPEEIYKAPTPLSGGAWSATTGCPNPEGVEDMPLLLIETAVTLMQGLNSGNLDQMREVADPALWPLLNPEGVLKESITDAWIREIQPVSDSPFTDLVSAQCGENTMRLSWWFEFCPGACSGSGEFEALITQVFVISRNGQWLIWAVY